MEILAQKVEEKSSMDEISQALVYTIAVIGLAVMLVAVRVHLRRQRDGQFTIEGQKYLDVLLFHAQIIDVISDICFCVQLREYYDYGKTQEGVDAKDTIILLVLWIVSLVFVSVPYFSNIWSSVLILRSINEAHTTSDFTVRYFSRNASVYSILTILSGGSFPALKVMNSNIFSLPQFGAGLSPTQLAAFQKLHLFSTILLENVPQLAIQGFVLWYLHMSGPIVFISFFSSVFNILTSILTAVVHIVLHRNSTEAKFVIKLSWSRLTAGRVETKSEQVPSVRIGRRQRLRDELDLMNYGGHKSMNFEIVASKRQRDSCLLYGVIHVHGDYAAAMNALVGFQGRTNDIKAAVMKAFDYADFPCHDFEVGVSSNYRPSVISKYSGITGKPDTNLEMVPDESVCYTS